MDEPTIGTTEAPESEVQISSWEAAFAALEPKSEEPDTGIADDSGVDDSAAEQVGGQQELPDNDAGGNDGAHEGDAGGLDTDAGEPGADDGSSLGSFAGYDVEQFEKDLRATVSARAERDVTAEFIKRGVRNTDGKIGATIKDSDISKVDEDGVRHYYNPETGQEFTGQNPRRQAQEWVDDYNKELEQVFENTKAQYEQHLLHDEEPRLAVMKFAPKYDKLDDIRKGMFDNVVQDYEVKDSNGDIIGYSCDLDKALALVERQIAMIQDYAKKHQVKAEEKKPTGPALDMKTSSGAIPSGDMEPPKSLAEAMEREQDRLLAKMRK